MPRIILKRFPRILAFIAVGTIIFLSFQFFSLKILNSSSGKTSNDHILSKSDDDEIDFRVVGDKLPDASSVKQKLPPGIPRGVHIDDAEFYKPVNDGMFRCLHSKKLVPFSQVNDDFCDCEDSTDEPGTAACPNGRFYCRTQMPDRNAQDIPSSRVNDGVCDCCDGSDEWANQPPPKSIRIKGKNIMSQAPCTDKCAKVIKVNKENEKIRSLGKRLKAAYIEEAKGLYNKAEYGPEGVFYKLSKQCYTFHASEYQYDVCPFQTIKQSKYSINHTVLGKSPKWKQKSHGRYILEMKGGDATLCPQGQMRSSLILFLCGINDRVVSIQEDEKCTYVIKFATPAAC